MTSQRPVNPAVERDFFGQALRGTDSSGAEATSPKRKIKKPNKEQLAAWESARLDINNWLTIPEFGVTPGAHCDGFYDPVIDPWTTDMETAEGLREVVHVVRSLARQMFESLSDLRSAYVVVLDKVDADEHVFSERDRAAWLYTTVMSDIRAWKKSSWLTAAKRQARALGAASAAAVWALEGSESATQKLKRLKPFEDAK